MDKKKYVQGMEKQLNWLGEKIDELLKNLEKDTRKGCRKLAQEIRSEEGDLHKKWVELKKASGKAWEDLRPGVEAAWGSLRHSVESAASRFSKDKAKSET